MRNTTSCDELRAMLPDYWAGRLPEASRSELDAHLAACATCRDDAEVLGELWRRLDVLEDEEPSSRLQARFDAMLDGWREGRSTGQALAFRPRRSGWQQAAWSPAFQAAAALLLVAGGFIAGQLLPDRQSIAELAELRGEVRSMREVVAISLLQQQSASERLRGVTWSHQIERPGEQVISALLDTLQHDANVNVRLASIDALRQFGHEQHVREGLVEAVGQPQSPLVQVELIDLLVELRERRSRGALQTLSQDDRVDRTVRERARWGLSQIG